MMTVMIICIIIVFVVLFLTLLTTNKAYKYEHTVDEIDGASEKHEVTGEHKSSSERSI